MGLFSSKKKKVVGTSITRVIEDSDIPTPFQQSVISAIMRNESVSDNVIDELINGRVSAFNRVFNYAKTHNYIYGLPDETVSETVGSRSIVESTISSTLPGTLVSTNYYRLLPLNFIHYVYQKLVEVYQYNGQTNELKTVSAQTGFPTYLKSFQVRLPGSEDDYNESSLMLWGTHPEARFSPSRPTGVTNLSPLIVYGSSLAITVTAEWLDTSGGGTVTVPYEAPDLSEPVVLSGGYTPPSLTAPVVLSDSEEVDGGGSQLQETSLSLANPSLNQDSLYHQIEYVHSSGEIRTWSYLHGSGTYPAIDSGAISNSLTSSDYMPFTFFISNGFNLSADGRESTPEYQSADRFLGLLGMDFKEIGDKLDENPDIDDVRQAAIVFALDMASDDADELEYLFKHFKHFYDVSTPIPLSRIATGTDPNYSIDFSDSDFRIELDYRGITFEVKTGSIGTVGTYAGVTTSEQYTYEYSGTDGTPQTVTSNYRARRIRKQITSNSYEEYTLHDPRGVYYVEGNRAVYVQLDDEEGRLLLPIKHGLMRELSYIQKERIFLRSMHFVFNSLQVIKVKWYQTGIFKAFLVVVAVVITVVSAGAGIGALSASLGISTLAATVLYTVIAISISFAFKFTIRELGLENSWIAVAIVIAIAAYAGYSGESFAGFLDAKTLISLASGLANEIGTYANQLVAKYQGELQEFELYKEEKWEELEEVSKLLDTTDLLDPYDFIGLQPIVIPGESSDSFYQRTIHSGNIGTQVFDMVHNYVDTNLRLPTFEDSVRSTFYGRTN